MDTSKINSLLNAKNIILFIVILFISIGIGTIDKSIRIEKHEQQQKKDEQRLERLLVIKKAIDSYAEDYNTLPNQLSDLIDTDDPYLSSSSMLNDPISGQPFYYELDRPFNLAIEKNMERFRLKMGSFSSSIRFEPRYKLCAHYDTSYSENADIASKRNFTSWNGSLYTFGPYRNSELESYIWHHSKGYHCSYIQTSFMREL